MLLARIVNTMKSKGKTVEMRRRKTTGLQPKGHDRRVAEGYDKLRLWVIPPMGFFVFTFVSLYSGDHL